MRPNAYFYVDCQWLHLLPPASDGVFRDVAASRSSWAYQDRVATMTYLVACSDKPEMPLSYNPAVWKTRMADFVT
jgi:hypothetical protein